MTWVWITEILLQYMYNVGMWSMSLHHPSRQTLWSLSILYPQNSLHNLYMFIADFDHNLWVRSSLINTSNPSVTSAEAQISSFLIGQHQRSPVSVVRALIWGSLKCLPYITHFVYACSDCIYNQCCTQRVEEDSDWGAFGFTYTELLSDVSPADISQRFLLMQRCKYQLATILQLVSDWKTSINPSSVSPCLAVCLLNGTCQQSSKCE